MHSNNQLALSFLLLFSQSIIIVQTCSVIKLTTAEELVSQADAIVRAKAVDYEKAPDNSNSWTNGIPDPIIRFKVEEIIKSNRMIPDSLLINGYLSQDDDYNDSNPPYNFVRPGGRSGSCFANSYKQEASFLLFLNDKYTPYWSALAPVNEQLYSPPFEDKWLQWVKNQVVVSSYGQIIDPIVTSGANKLRSFLF